MATAGEFLQDSRDGIVFITRRAATLYVGLKSCILSGYPLRGHPKPFLPTSNS
ncbi:hypothetical protein Barb7_03274 [Bacteroidales bacterium Barb7]|nr:hypothetical protein Barb7_03274 [Bacteroidales bacterium Barb7]